MKEPTGNREDYQVKAEAREDRARDRQQRSQNSGQYAPLQLRTAQTVRIRMVRSTPSDILRMYSRSSSIHSSKGTELLPRTCHKHVIPGFTLNRRRCQSSLKPL